MGAPPNMLYARAREEQSPALSVEQRPAGKGLLSNFKNNQLLQSTDWANTHSSSLVEQDTLKQPKIQQPTKESTTDPARVQNYPWAQVSPHPSRISLLANLPADVQNRPANGPTSTPRTTPAPPNLQPFQPFVASPYSPDQQAFQAAGHFPSLSIPNQPQAAWQGQPIPIGYQGPGLAGAPPFVQGPPGESAKNGRRKKKRRFPIWARIVIAILTVFIILGGSLFYYYQVNFAAPVNGIVGQPAPRLKSDEAPNQGRGDTSGGI